VRAPCRAVSLFGLLTFIISAIVCWAQERIPEDFPRISPFVWDSNSAPFVFVAELGDVADVEHVMIERLSTSVEESVTSIEFLQCLNIDRTAAGDLRLLRSHDAVYVPLLRCIAVLERGTHVDPVRSAIYEQCQINRRRVAAVLPFYRKSPVVLVVLAIRLKPDGSWKNECPLNGGEGLSTCFKRTISEANVGSQSKYSYNFYNLFFLIPAAILSAIGAAMIAYGLYCAPTPIGVLLVLLAGAPICSAVWIFVFKVVG
jgi:hypothetical protein